MMPPSPEWKSSLSALDRYDVVRKMPASDAIAVEQAAYDTSSTRDEYDAACASAAREPLPLHPDVATPPPDAIRIGPYQGCTFVAEGVTSEVYRAGDFALKVITTSHRSMEPHNPQREAKILAMLRPPCIPLLDVFRHQGHQLVLRFPFMPLTLSQLLAAGPLSKQRLRAIFTDTLRALGHIHALGIVHRDIKPSAVLLSSPSGPAFLSDFGTAWHPELSAHSEPAADKILDIGTGSYRAPEVLFGNKAYGAPVDMWGFGVMLAESICSPPVPPFESRPVDEDGNQLGLILSIFKTLGRCAPASIVAQFQRPVAGSQ
ncbi:serine/threonine protein kinase, CMGC group [Ophiocordyceps sinensis CO18]|uniref:cyclin-dependent kinase n=1 Tax=Ophiocordyceps sinensis (strain Co18 / CGMCC 3.14243) TaxID=911162 RepID=T5AEE0_OPHSC|nr:serine/threonine protein kinase, CMGC group [Ophiocordyceps sinensis CO18]